ncbi:AraC family transcriptional regulator [Methylobacterium sp. NEAU K]|uniref:AraC family transcriptional regulator n=1 Tax=Methylobacterium sp. NEAU K TaxID=3064946 RepID=UPI002735E0CE|nr:AraC family transcriptional regulator [Methylobacterium sp. NEAU K]MDP4002748.1 AraC family transcriptional regulator [Methylobacterium sp. NEAU K]
MLLALGLDPAPVIAAAGLDPALLEDAENLLPASWLGRLLSACGSATGCPCLALRVGARAGLSSLGMVGLLMQNSPTVADALGSLIRHGHLYHPEIVPTLEITDGTAVLRYRILPADLVGSDESAECALAAGFRIMRALCGPEWLPGEILLARGIDGRAAAFRQVFGVPVRSNEEASTLVFPARWLDQPVAGADLGFQRLLERQVAHLEDMSDEPLVDQIRRSLRPLLLGEGCSAARAAGLFALHSRTLSRRLKAEGFSFQRLVDDVRYELACHLLRNASMPLARAAAALGYSEASAFTRAFRRWSGTTPKAWRIRTASALSRERDARQEPALVPRLVLRPVPARAGPSGACTVGVPVADHRIVEEAPGAPGLGRASQLCGGGMFRCQPACAQRIFPRDCP